jgi:anti-anti-sigma factor
MAPLLQSATTPLDGPAIVTVRGDIDADTAAQLWQFLGYLILQGHHHIVLDLRSMILINSAGVEVLAGVSGWTRREDGDLVLRCASAAVAEQLELARRTQAHRQAQPSAAGGKQGGARSDLASFLGAHPVHALPRAATGSPSIRRPSGRSGAAAESVGAELGQRSAAATGIAATQVYGSDRPIRGPSRGPSSMVAASVLQRSTRPWHTGLCLEGLAS